MSIGSMISSYWNAGDLAPGKSPEVKARRELYAKTQQDLQNLILQGQSGLQGMGNQFGAGSMNSAMNTYNPQMQRLGNYASIDWQRDMIDAAEQAYARQKQERRLRQAAIMGFAGQATNQLVNRFMPSPQLMALQPGASEGSMAGIANAPAMPAGYGMPDFQSLLAMIPFGG